MHPRRDINDVVRRVLYRRGCDSVTVKPILAYHVAEYAYAGENRRGSMSKIDKSLPHLCISLRSSREWFDLDEHHGYPLTLNLEEDAKIDSFSSSPEWSSLMTTSVNPFELMGMVFLPEVLQPSPRRWGST